MIYNEPSPLEVKLISQRFQLENSASIDTYLATEGYVAIKKALQMTPEAIIDEMKASNLRGSGWDFDIYTHTGAGAYECGEESALLESLEGKRGIPRLKPPFPAVVGAWQSPTLLNNCETFSTVPVILRMGGAAYAEIGTLKN